MQKCYSLSFCAGAWLLVNELNPRIPTPLQHGIDVRDRDTNVMYAWTTPREVLADWRIGIGWLQKLDERFTALHGGDPRAV